MWTVSVPYQLQWICASHNVDMSVTSLDLATSPNSPNLVIKPNVLVAGETYTFALIITSPDYLVSSQSNKTFTVNSAPSGGSCAIFPSSGTALLTVFRVFCTGWTDSDGEGDFPLSYAFSLRESATDMFTVLQTPQNSATFSGFLPATSAAGGQMTITIADSFGAGTRTSLWVNVSNPVLNSMGQVGAVASTMDTVIALALQAGNVNTMVQAVSCMSNMLTATSLDASSGMNATSATAQRTTIRENMMTAISTGANLSTISSGTLSIAAATQLMTTTAAVVSVPSEVPSGVRIEASKLASSVSHTLLSSTSAPLPSTYAQAVIDVVANVLLPTVDDPTRTGGTVNPISLSLARLSTDAVALVARGVLVGSVPGEDPHVVTNTNIAMRTQRDAAAHLTARTDVLEDVRVALPGAWSSPSAIPAVVDSTLVRFTQNFYDVATGTRTANQSAVARGSSPSSNVAKEAPVISFTLSLPDGDSLSIHGLTYPILLTIPHPPLPKVRFEFGCHGRVFFSFLRRFFE